MRWSLPTYLLQWWEYPRSQLGGGLQISSQGKSPTFFSFILQYTSSGRRKLASFLPIPGQCMPSLIFHPLVLVQCTRTMVSRIPVVLFGNFSLLLQGTGIEAFLPSCFTEKAAFFKAGTYEHGVNNKVFPSGKEGKISAQGRVGRALVQWVEERQKRRKKRVWGGSGLSRLSSRPECQMRWCFCVYPPEALVERVARSQ